jgi:hypothetical protein
VLESRWLRFIGTGVIALVAVGSVASTASGAGQRPWKGAACADEPGSRATAARWEDEIDLAELRTQPWFRQDPRLDRAGALQGQRLAVGLDGERSSRILDLPPESFAAGPFGRVVLVGSDDGSTSRVAALDVTGECSWTVAEESSAVIRRATIDPRGETLFEMRVDRVTRTDLGVWARPLDGSRPAFQIIEPIELDERFGRTYATEFTWDLAGQRLAIQSCGELACRTRVYDPAGGPLRTIAEADLGEIVGLSGDDLATYGACGGWPCPVVTVHLETGSRRVLAEGAAVAILVATTDGPRLVHEVLADTGVTLLAVSLDGATTTDLGRLPDGHRLHAAPSVAESATEVPAGWVLVGPDGRIPDTGPTAQTQLRHVVDGITVQLQEVAP